MDNILSGIQTIHGSCKGTVSLWKKVLCLLINLFDMDSAFYPLIGCSDRNRLSGFHIHLMNHITLRIAVWSLNFLHIYGFDGCLKVITDCLSIFPGSWHFH